MSYSDILLKIAKFKQTDFYLELTQFSNLPPQLKDATTIYPENVVHNLTNLAESFDNLKEANRNSAAVLATQLRDNFGTNNLFLSLENKLNKATQDTLRALGDFHEAVAIGNLNPIEAENFIAIANGILQEIKQQTDSINNYKAAIIQGNDIPPAVMQGFDESQQQLSASLLTLQEAEARVKVQLNAAKIVRSDLAEGSSKVSELLKGAIKDFRSAYSAIFKGNSTEAIRMLRSLHEKISASTQILKRANRPATGKMAVMGGLTGLASVMSSFIKGIEFLVKPASLFFGGGIVGLAKLLFEILASVRDFNKTLMEHRGARQLNIDMSFGLDSNIVKAEIQDRNLKFAETLSDTHYEFLNTSNNIYTLTKEQFIELDALTSRIHLQTVKNEVSESIDSVDAQFTLANEVVTFSTALGVDQKSIADHLDMMVNEQQTSFEVAGLSLSYLADVAARNNISTVRLFNNYQNLQKSSADVGTNVSFVLDVLGLLQSTKTGSDQEKVGFFSEAVNFLTGSADYSFTMIIDRKDLSNLVKTYRQTKGIKGNEVERLSRLNMLEKAVQDLYSKNAAISEFSRGQLEYLLSKEPELAISFTFLVLKKVLQRTSGINQDIGKMSGQDLIKFLVNQRVELRSIFGNHFNYVEKLIQILAVTKLNGKTTVNSAEDFVKNLHRATASAKVLAQTRKVDLIKKAENSRGHTNNMFSGMRNWVDALVFQVSPFLEGLAGILQGVVNLFSGAGLRGVLESIRGTFVQTVDFFRGKTTDPLLYTSFRDNYSKYVQLLKKAEELAKSYNDGNKSQLIAVLEQIRKIREILIIQQMHTSEDIIKDEDPLEARQRAEERILRRGVYLDKVRPEIDWRKKLQPTSGELDPFLSTNLEAKPVVTPLPSNIPPSLAGVARTIVPNNLSKFSEVFTQVLGATNKQPAQLEEAINLALRQVGDYAAGDRLYGVEYKVDSTNVKRQILLDADMLRVVSSIFDIDTQNQGKVMKAFLTAAGRNAGSGASPVEPPDGGKSRLETLLTATERILGNSLLSGVGFGANPWGEIRRKIVKDVTPQAAQTGTASSSGATGAVSALPPVEQTISAPSATQTAAARWKPSERLDKPTTNLFYEGMREVPSFITTENAFSLFLDKFSAGYSKYFLGEVNVHVLENIQYFDQSASTWRSVSDKSAVDSVAKPIIEGYFRTLR